jgi:hypothetical protein
MEELIAMVERDLREVVGIELMKFRDRYPECIKVDSVYLNEHFSVSVYDIQVHGLRCSHHLNIFIAGNALFEFPEFGCFVEFIDPEYNFKRDLAYIKLVYTPANRCYIKTEIHEIEIRETAEHIVRVAAALEAEQG